MRPETPAPNRRVGYARVSTKQQDLTRQFDALKRAGCHPVFADQASGKSIAGRPQLEAALLELREGDELILAEWDRCTRSMWDGLQIIRRVLDAKAFIRVLDRSYIDLRTPMGQGFMALFSAMAEDERLRILKRTHEGRQVAMTRGVRMGRKPKLTPKQVEEVRRRAVEGETQQELAASYNVSRSSIQRVLT